MNKKYFKKMLGLIIAETVMDHKSKALELLQQIARDQREACAIALLASDNYISNRKGGVIDMIRDAEIEEGKCPTK